MNSTPSEFEVEADSPEGARRQARSRVPAGLKIASEEILDAGGTRTVQGVGGTVETAFQQAGKSLPPGAIEQERRITKPPIRVIEVTAPDESAAKNLAEGKIEPGESVARISVKVAGRKGFLGMGRTPSTYEVEMARWAIVEIVFTSRARIRCVLGSLPSRMELMESVARLAVTAETARARYPAARARAGPIAAPAAHKLLLVHIGAPFDSLLRDAKAVFPDNSALQELPELGWGEWRSASAHISPIPAMFDMAISSIRRLLELVGFEEGK